MDLTSKKDMPRVDTLIVTSQPERSTIETAQLAFQSIAERDLGALAALQDSEIESEVLALDLVLRGRSAVRGFYEELYASFPDFTLEAERMVVAGTTATTQWVSWGTFTGGPFQGFLPTGRTVRVRGVTCDVIEDGKILYDTLYYDGATFARGIGLLPQAGGRGERYLTSAFNLSTKVRNRFRRD